MEGSKQVRAGPGGAAEVCTKTERTRTNPHMALSGAGSRACPKVDRAGSRSCRLQILPEGYRGSVGDEPFRLVFDVEQHTYSWWIREPTFIANTVERNDPVRRQRLRSQLQTYAISTAS